MPNETFTETLLFIDVVIILGILAISFREEYPYKRVPRGFSILSLKFATASAVLLFFSYLLGVPNPFVYQSKVAPLADVFFGLGALFFLLNFGELYHLARYRIDETYRPMISMGRAFVLITVGYCDLVDLAFFTSYPTVLTFFSYPWPYPALAALVILGFIATIPTLYFYNGKFSLVWVLPFVIVISPILVAFGLTGSL